MIQRADNEPQAAIFFDKDGTLIEDRPFNVDPRLIEFTSGAEAALRALHRRGYKIIIITNQSGVALGHFPESRLIGVEQKLKEMIERAGAELDGFYYCPHHPAGKVDAYSRECLCRKPEPGLIYRAARERNVDLARSWFIGDILHDIEAGTRAGMRTILIDNGNETEWELTPQRQPHYVTQDLWEAARTIIKEERDVSLEGLETDSLRALGLDGRRAYDRAGDPRVEGVQSSGADLAAHFAIRR